MNRFNVSASVQLGSRNMATPFHEGRKRAHHATSALAYALTFLHTCSSGRPSTDSHASGISRSLDRDLASLVSKALAGSTTATYKVGIRRYVTFCRHLEVAAVPSTRRHVALFATHLSSYLRLPTIRVYLAAVSFLHRASGHRSPVGNNPLLKLVIRGIRRKQAQLPLSKSRLPITPKILRDLVKQLHRDPTITQHDKLMLLPCC